MSYTLKEIKLYSATAIMESKLSTKEKISMLKEIKDSDAYKVMAFLNKGQLFSGELTEDIKKDIIDKFYKNTALTESLDEFTFGLFIQESCKDKNFTTDLTESGMFDKKEVKIITEGLVGDLNKGREDLFTRHYNVSQGQANMAAAGVAVAAGVMGYKIFKRFFTQVGKQCKNFNGEEYKKCAARVKAQGQQAAIAKMKQIMATQCKKTKDPKGCAEKINAKIAAMQAKMGK